MLPPADLRTLLETGRAEIHSNLEALEAASQANSRVSVRRFAHRLAGSAGVLGLDRLMAAARAAELAAEAQDDDAFRATRSDVRSAAAQALAELDRWLAPVAAE